MHRYTRTGSAALLGIALWALGPAEEAALLPAFVSTANAVIGRPLTPASAAGVARRTTRRAVVVSESAAAATPPPQTAPVATVGAAVVPGTTVAALPAGCTSATIGGVGYFNCAGTYYKPAYQSNNLVYVVTQP
jgi:hypothetical protein